MALLVLDSAVLVSAYAMPEGQSAKLLTLLAYGWHRHYVDVGAPAEARLTGQPIDPLRMARAEKNLTLLAQSIPHDGHLEIWRLACSQMLIDRVVARIGELRDTRHLGLNSETVATALAPHFSRWIAGRRDAVPRYTSDIDCDVAVHTALRAGAELVVTKLAAYNTGTWTKCYSTDPADDCPLGVTAVTHFDLVVSELTAHFDFPAIDATVLERIAPGGA